MFCTNCALLLLALRCPDSYCCSVAAKHIGLFAGLKVKTVCLVQVVDVADDTISIRSLDWDRDRFDIEFGLQEGTTYNSFLIFGDKTCLVDASHEKFKDLYMKTLKDQLAERGRTLDYIVVSHTEPDHSGKQSWFCKYN